MRNEMKMGLGIGLVVLLFVVGYVMVNQGGDAPDAGSDATMTDAGTTGGGDAADGSTTGNERAAAGAEHDDSSDTETSVPRTGYDTARRTEEERSTTLADSGRHAVAGGSEGASDAAEAPATTGSEGVGSPSPSVIPGGLSETDRPGLAESTAGTPDATAGSEKATGATETHDMAASRGDESPDPGSASASAGSAATGSDGFATKDGLDSGWLTTDRERTAPSTDDAETSGGGRGETLPAKDVSTTHTIEAGDTFSGLAVRYFGHAKYAGLISDANPDVDPRRLHVGKAITIPDTPLRKERQRETISDSASTAGGADSSSVASSNDAGTTGSASLPPIPEDRRYVVQASDRGWYELAERFWGKGGEWPLLYETNKERLPDPDNSRLLPVGLVIEIPELKE